MSESNYQMLQVLAASHGTTPRQATIDRMNDLAADAARYRYLRDHCVRITPGNMNGPGHPVLEFSYDIWADDVASWTGAGLGRYIDEKIRKLQR
jgi:hypothetical protein